MNLQGNSSPFLKQRTLATGRLAVQFKIEIQGRSSGDTDTWVEQLATNAEQKNQSGGKIVRSTLVINIGSRRNVACCVREGRWKTLNISY